MGGQNPAIVLPDADPAVPRRPTIAGAVAGLRPGRSATATKAGESSVGDCRRGSPTPWSNAIRQVADRRSRGRGHGRRNPSIDGAARQTRSSIATTSVRGGRRARVLTGGRAARGAGFGYVAPTLGGPRSLVHHLLETATRCFGPICAISTVPPSPRRGDQFRERTCPRGPGRRGSTPMTLAAALHAANSPRGWGMVKVNAPTAGVRLLSARSGGSKGLRLRR